LTFYSNGSFIYSPNSGFVGSDNFTYRAYDGYVVSNIATVYINVTPTNDPPVANDDYYTTDEDTTLNVPAPGVLENDTDPENDPLIAILVSDVSNGVLNLNINGAFSYTPNTNYYGTDTFTYQAYDGMEYSNTATVTITINPINDPPTANNDYVSVNEDSIDDQLDVLLNDFDIDEDDLEIIGFTVPSHGNVTFTSDYLFYTPDQNYNGFDDFNYTITDNNGETDTANVNITVTPVNDPPYTPSDPVPNNGQPDVDINADLSWISGDLDGDPVTYDVYFGLTSPPPKIVSNQSDTTYSPETMNHSTEYHWKIIAWDNQGASASGPIWNFTTEGEYDWECILAFEEPNGEYDDVYFGEKLTASDNQDSYDEQKEPAGLPPYIRACFVTDFPDPYDELWKEYKHSPDDYKLWNLTIKWVPSDNSSPTDITISWNSSYLNDSEYSNIFLKNNASDETINMFVQNNYTFNASALVTYQFKIICSNKLEITSLHTNWNIISLPFNQSVIKSNVIVRHNKINYSWQDAVDNQIILGFIYSWSRNAPQHYELTNILKPGYGYWVYAYKTCTLLAEGISTKNNDGYITSMLKTWNIVGLPNIVSLQKENLIVRYKGEYYSWHNATTKNNPTGGPIILGYIYNWSRSSPQHYELTNVFAPGFGYQMYAYKNCSLYYYIAGPLGRFPLNKVHNVIEQSSLKYQTDITAENKIYKKWEISLDLSEPGGAYDNAFFGEKNDAADGQDVYDVPKNPSSLSPFIHVWFETSCITPYDNQWKEYKHSSNNYNDWNLTVQWIPSDHISPTKISMSWDINSDNIIEYKSIILYDLNNNRIAADMLIKNNYSFTCKALKLQKFKIICSTNQRPILLNSPKPNNGSIGVDTEINLSWYGGGYYSSDTITYDIYFGKTSPPPNVIENQFATIYNPGNLEKDTVYYWKIIAKDNHGTITIGPIWEFKTKEYNPNITTISTIVHNLKLTTQKLLISKIINNKSN